MKRVVAVLRKTGVWLATENDVFEVPHGIVLLSLICFLLAAAVSSLRHPLLMVPGGIVGAMVPMILWIFGSALYHRSAE